jgi:hypothetical protein
MFYLLNYEQAYECVFNEDPIFRWSDRHTVFPMVVVLREVVREVVSNVIVGAIQMLEGQNSVLNQIVYDTIQGRYGGPSQTSLADSLSQSLSTSMVEQVCLFNLLMEHVNQD